MRNLNFILISLAVLSLLFIQSCNAERMENNETDLNNLRTEVKNKELTEISKLVGMALQDKSLRKHVLSEMKSIDAYGKSISLAYLLGNENNVSSYEKRKLEKLSNETGKRISSNGKFKEKLTNLFHEKKKEFPQLTKAISSNNNTATGKLANLEITQYMEESNLEMYFPYEENFNWDEIDEYSVTFEDNNPYAIHEGFMINGVEYDYIDGIDEEYLYNNPTIALVPIDNYYLGDQVAYDYNGFEYITDPYNYASIPLNPIATYPPAPSNSKVRVKSNMDPYALPENHLITTFIPKVMVRGTSWKRTLSKALRMKIAKAGSEVAVNPTGGLTAIAGAYYFRFDISASDLRNHRWKDVGILWEPNWHKAKVAQQMVVWGLRKNASESTVSVGSKLAIDDKGNYTPSTSVNVNHTVKSGETAIFRGNKELDRVQVLSSVVGGSELDNKTYNYDATNYSVRKVDLFEFFFVHDYTAF